MPAYPGAPHGRAIYLLDAVLRPLIGMLPGVGKIKVTAHAVEVEGPGIGRIPLGALSDGYLTTAGWVLDLIARWSEDAMRRGIELDGSFREKMTGVAIVDEIDLHLHPRWQRDVVADVRRLFPRMSFVVTTHNPLTLLGGKRARSSSSSVTRERAASRSTSATCHPALGPKAF